MIRVLLLAVLASTSSAEAHDWGAREGVFRNLSSAALWCFADRAGELAAEQLLPGGECRADAVGRGAGAGVFKIPNRTVFTVSARGVRAEDVESRALLVLAKLRHGQGRYGLMSWDHFLDVMGHGPGRNL